MLEDILTNARILIVDDQETNNFLLESILELNGYNHFKSLTDPRQALTLYAEYQPDLILLDLMMPHLDGFAIMEGLRPLIPADTYLPILVLTADVTAETKRRALSSGAFDFLTKPLDTVEVMLRIRNLLETRFLHLQLQNQNQILEQKVLERTAQLTESEAKHRILIEQIPAITYIDDPVAGLGEIQFVSQQIEQLLGITPEEWIKGGYELWSQTIHAEDRERVLADYHHHIDSGEPFECEYRLLARDGRVVWIRDTARLMRDKDDQPHLIHGIMLDITERVQADEAQRESEEKYRQLVEFAPDGILIHVDGEIVFANSACAKILGPAAPNDLIGKPMLDFVHPDYQEIVKNRVRQITEDKQEIPLIEEKHVRLDGAVIDTEVKAIPFRYGNKNAVQVVINDITERKQAEAALAHRAEELAALQATVLEITASHDLSSLLQTIVERAAHLLGADGGGLYLCDPEKQKVRCVVSYNTIKDYTGTVLKYGEGAAGKVAQSGKPLIIEDYRIWSGGAEIYKKDQPFRALVSVPMFWQGQVTGVLHTLRSVKDNPFTQADLDFLSLFANHAAIAVENTRLLDRLLLELKERKQAEALIEEQAERFRTMLSTITEGFWLADDQGRLLDVNQAYCQMSAYSKDELLTLSIPDLEAAESFEATAEHIQTIIETGSDRFETMHKTKDGRVFDVEISAVFWPARRQFFVFIQDISERKQIERELKAQKEFAFQVMNTMGEGLTVTSAEGNFEYVNSTYARMLGCSSQQLMGRNLFEFIALEDQAAQAQAWIQRARGETSAYEVRLQRADGTTFPASITGVPRFQDGEFMGSIAVVTDLTERKRKEEELRQRDKLLNEMSRIARIGAWEFDSMTHQGTWSEETARIHDMDPADETNVEIGISFYKDESRAKIEKAVREAVELGKPYELELELVTVKGTHKWVRTIGRPIREGDKVVKVRGTFQDITEQVQAEEALHASEARYRSLFENMTEGFAYCKMIFEDSQPVDFTYLDVNNAFEVQTGLKDVVGRSVLEVIPGIRESNPELFDTYGRVATSGKAERFEIYLEPLAMWFSISAYSPQKEYFVAVFEVITERKQAEQALEQKARELQTLYDISLMVSARTSLDNLLPVIVQQAASLLRTDSSSLYLMQADGGSLKLAISHNFPQDYLNVSLKLGEGLAGQAAQSGKSINVENYQAWPGRADVFSETPFRRTLGVPLKVKEKVIGVISVLDLNLTGLFSTEQMQLMSLFADQAALAIESARLHEQEHKRNRELATLYESAMTISSNLSLEVTLKTVVEQMTRAINTDGCALSFWDQERDSITTMFDYRISSTDTTDIPGTAYLLEDYPATRRVLETRQPLIQVRSDPQTDPAELAVMEKLYIGTELLLPLVARDKVIGLMELYIVKNNERVFTEDEIRLAQSLSVQTAIFIDNARLFEQAERRLRRTEALHKIDIAIAGSVDVNVIFNVILDQAFAQLGMDAIGVLLFDPVTQVLQYAAGRGFRTQALQETHLPLGQGYAGRAALERKTIHISELQTRKTDFLRSPSFSQEEFVSYYGVPLVAKGQIKGVLEIFHRRAFEAEAEWLDFLETLAGQTAIAIDNATLFKDLQLSNIELTLAYDATIEGWSHAMDLRDKETQDHTLRVTQMTEGLARTLGIGDSDLVHIRRGALLHDIGKMGVPDSVLLKAGKLTDEEWELMRRHPQFAYDMLAPIVYLRPAMDIPYCHHEKWDGTGYPRGLKGEQIPLAARIFAVVDVYDALTSDRPYRKAWSKKKTLEYIREQSGTHFDPAVVDAFLKSKVAAPKKKKT